MEKIQLLNVSFSYGERDIINVDELTIYEKQKIGIVGVNGSGKTTLLKLINRELQPETGTIKTKGKIAYAKQLEEETNMFSTQSGGEKMMELLTEKLQEKPDILLLDEPSSNLDYIHLETITQTLKKYTGTLLMISHDRTLLDEICQYILEVDDGKLQLYRGNYSSYHQQKTEQRQRKINDYEQYKKEKTRLEQAAINSNNRAKAMKKAPTRMGNSEARLHKRETDNIREKVEKHKKALETRISQLEKPEKPKTDYSVHFKVLDSQKVKKKEIIISDKFTLKIAEKLLIQEAKFVILTNKITALMGRNGSGKTTLIQAILKQNPHIQITPQAKIGYFSQNLDTLTPSQTILENLKNTSIQEESTMRSVLAKLQIQGNKVHQLVSSLSGGEKVKVALAKLLVAETNFLILDEPTNFLDIESIEALTELMKQYPGTILLVSHDRKLIDEVANELLIIEHKRLIHFSGNYTAYQESKTQKQKSKSNQNDTLLFNFKLSKLDTQIALTKDEEQKNKLIEERNELIKKEPRKDKEDEYRN